MLILAIDPGVVIKRPERWLNPDNVKTLDLDELEQLERTGEQYCFFDRREEVKVGMNITIACACESYEHGWDNTWAEGMDDYIGRSGIVAEVSRSGIYMPSLTSLYHWPWHVCVPTVKQQAFPFYYDASRYGLEFPSEKKIAMAVDPRMIDTEEYVFLDGKAVEKKKRASVKKTKH